MKLAKLSLATIVALGAMTTIASATPLEEAIKGVELNGMVRYRFTDNSDAGKEDLHQYKVVTDFTVPVADALKAEVLLVANGANTGEEAAADGGSGITLNIERANFQYAANGLSVKFGKQEIFSPWTDPGYSGSVGDGIFALYSGVEGWTFGGAAFVNTNTIGAGENLYALGAIGSIDPVTVQLWASKMTNVFDYAVFGDIEFSMNGFTAELQANQLKLNDAMGSDESGLFYGAKLGYAANGFSGKIGYTKNDKDQPIYSLAGSDAMGFIFSGGKQINSIVANESDAQLMFVDLGYKVDKFGLGAGYAQGDFKLLGADVDVSEFYGLVSYSYSKNFKLTSWYSSLGKDADNDRIRFEAKYSF